MQRLKSFLQNAELAARLLQRLLACAFYLQLIIGAMPPQ
jgi:hypothetical protein